MKMIDLEIGEHYAWRRKRVKLMATGVVLKYYQHKGVQIEVSGMGDAKRIEAVPARELVSSWDDFALAQAEWDKQKTEKHEAQRETARAKNRIMVALQKLELQEGVSAGAYPNYVMLTLDGPKPAHALADALQQLINYGEESAV